MHVHFFFFFIYIGYVCKYTSLSGGKEFFILKMNRIDIILSSKLKKHVPVILACLIFLFSLIKFANIYKQL